MTEVTAGILLEVQRRLESLYGLEHEAPVTDFLLSETEARAYPGGGSRTLVSEREGGVALGVILDEETIGRILQEAEHAIAGSPAPDGSVSFEMRAHLATATTPGELRFS